jgi:hypothetical protein
VKKSTPIVLSVLLLTLFACGSDDSSSNSDGTTSATDGSGTTDGTDGNEPIFEYVEIPAGPFTIPAGEERFYCYTTNLKEDVVVDRFEFDTTPVVHHVVMSKSTVAVKDGFEECNELFRSSWNPLYVTGTGNSPLVAPEGAGYVLTAGTPIVLQLHLLNTTAEEVTDSVVVRMRKSPLEEVDPIRMVVFGTLGLALDPHSESSAVSACDNSESFDIFAVFPHMHYMGTSMVVEAGPDKDQLKEVFRRDPYDFDDQRMEQLTLPINAGDHVKVTCNYNNTTDKIITFGESSNDEMCFFIGFATGPKADFAGCIGGSSFFPADCGTDPVNELGLGAKCSKDGGECENGLLCTKDLLDGSDLGICIGLNTCQTSSDCGTGGICCSPSQIDASINLCVPKSCMIPGCEVK